MVPGKLSYRELATMLVMQNDPSVPEEAKELNRLTAAAELSDLDVYRCYRMKMDHVIYLASQRIEHGQKVLMDRAGRGEREENAERMRGVDLPKGGDAPDFTSARDWNDSMDGARRIAR